VFTFSPCCSTATSANIRVFLLCVRIWRSIVPEPPPPLLPFRHSVVRSVLLAAAVWCLVTLVLRRIWNVARIRLGPLSRRQRLFYFAGHFLGPGNVRLDVPRGTCSRDVFFCESVLTPRRLASQRFQIFLGYLSLRRYPMTKHGLFSSHAFHPRLIACLYSFSGEFPVRLPSTHPDSTPGRANLHPQCMITAFSTVPVRSFPRDH